MKENELRIGNWVNQPQLPHIAKITAIDYRGDDYYCKFENIHSGCWCSHIEPIPLTNELLLKCGFEYREESSSYDICKLRIRITDSCISAYIGVEYTYSISYYDTSLSIKHLHQLQNLYFVLTGKELNISL